MTTQQPSPEPSIHVDRYERGWMIAAVQDWRFLLRERDGEKEVPGAGAAVMEIAANGLVTEALVAVKEKLKVPAWVKVPVTRPEPGLIATGALPPVLV